MQRRRQWHPTPVLLPGKPHGWRTLVGSSPWGCEESHMTEQFHFHFSLSRIGKGNGNLLQCSCLENPRDGGAWWAAVYGVTHSWTRLKRLSSSSSKDADSYSISSANFICFSKPETGPRTCFNKFPYPRQAIHWPHLRKKCSRAGIRFLTIKGQSFLGFASIYHLWSTFFVFM